MLMPDNCEQKYPMQNLIEPAAAGDIHSFRLLVNELSGYVYRLAFKILYNKDDAKDIVQESFINVWKHLNTYKPEIKFTTWLYKIAVNLCYDKIKKERRKNKLFQNYENDLTDLAFTQLPNMEDAVSNKDLAEMIEKLSNKLSTKQRMVFVLRDLQNLSIEETSQILNMSAGSVKTNLFHARKFIAGKLSNIERKEVNNEMR